MKINEVFDVLARYTLVLASALNNLGIFYLAFAPLTIYPVFWILNIFYSASLSGNIIMIYSGSSGLGIELVDACIAGFAYFLLFALNLATRGIKLKTRALSMLFSFAAFLLLNIIRIVVLSVLYLNNYAYFGIVHSLLWNVLSTLLVAAIWFLSAWLFRVKEFPGYSDLRFVYKSINPPKRKRR